MADYETVSADDLASASPPPTPSSPYETVNESNLVGMSATPMRGMAGGHVYPQAVLDRLKQGDAVTKAIGSFTQGAENAITSAVGTEEQANAFFAEQPGYQYASVLPLKWQYDAKGETKNLSLAWPGMIHDFVSAINESAVAIHGKNIPATEANPAGGVSPEAAFTVTAPFVLGDMSIVGRLANGGSFADVARVGDDTGPSASSSVGTLPTMAEAGPQADSVRTHFGLSPEVAAVIQKTYADKGISPAEVFADAHNPSNGVLADLAAKQVPGHYGGAYPVSDWMGRELPPEAPKVGPTPPEGPTATAGAPAPEAPPAAPTPPSGELAPPAPVKRGTPAVTAIRGTGEAMVPGLAERLTGEDIGRGFYSDADLPIRQRVDFDEQAAKVADMINTDPQRVVDAVMGKKPYPANTVPEIMLQGAKDYAERTGQWDLLRDLSTQSRVVKESSTIAMRLRAHQEIGTGGALDTGTRLADLENARAKALAAKGVTPEGETVKAERQFQGIKQQRQPDMNAWQKFAQSIVCK